MHCVLYDVVMPSRKHKGTNPLDEYCRSLLPNLVTFQTVVKFGGNDHAAVRLGLEAGTVSSRLKAIENALGNQLLFKTGQRRSRQLTEEGKQYLNMANVIVSQLETFLKVFQHLQEQHAHNVRVVTIHSAWFTYGPEIGAAFAKKHKGGSLQHEYCRQPDKVPEQVQNGEADIGIVSYLKHVKRPLQLDTWKQEPMILAVSKKKSRLRHHDAVAAKDIASEPFIGFDQDLRIAAEISKYLKRLHITMRRPQFFDDVSIIMDAVAANQGIAILPKPCAERRKPDIKTYPLPEPMNPRPLAVVYHQDALRRPAILAFLEVLGELRRAPTLSTLARE